MQNYNHLCHHGISGMKWKAHKSNDTSKEDINKKKTKKSEKKDSSKIVNDVINGKFGNGETRVSELKKAGYKYDKIQNLVNEKLLGKVAAKRIANRRKKGN